jgi:hypothetical protein
MVLSKLHLLVSSKKLMDLILRAVKWVGPAQRAKTYKGA